MPDTLQLEAKAFDRQILERVANGHVPDLRHTQPCDYFYNNIWRCPEYVKMYYGQAFDTVLGYIKNYSCQRPAILDAGCGPGFVSLELAREGYDVTGIDISAECINTAQKTASAEKFITGRKAPEYRVENFMDIRGRYDVVLFWATLHHFADCAAVLKKANELLNPGGLVIVFEPTRDRVTKENVLQIYLLEQLLALTGSYYKKPDANHSVEQIRQNIEKMYRLQRYETEDGKKLQSVNDNESGFEQMVPALKKQFVQLVYEDGSSFFPQIIGGLRMADMEQNLKMAGFIRMMDTLMCEMKMIMPTEFYFVGQKKDAK